MHPVVAAEHPLRTLHLQKVSSRRIETAPHDRRGSARVDHRCDNGCWDSGGCPLGVTHHAERLLVAQHLLHNRDAVPPQISQSAERLERSRGADIRLPEGFVSLEGEVGGHVADGAHRACSREHRRRPRVPRPHLAVEEHDACGGARGRHRLSLDKAAGERFLAEDVEASVGGADRPLRMQRRRQRHVDRVAHATLDELGVAPKDVRDAADLRPRGGAFEGAGGDGGDTSSRRLLDRPAQLVGDTRCA